MTSNTAILAELELRRREEIATIAEDWQKWLKRLYGDLLNKPFAEHHANFYRWLWSIDEKRPNPYIMILARGGGKSASAEAAVIALGALGKRSYGQYVRATQDQANESIANIMTLLEDLSIEELYPHLGDRKLGKFGQKKGWRRDYIHTLNDFVIEGFGLDSAQRGSRVDKRRPDFFIMDDIDELNDSPAVTEQKINTLSRSLLPALASNAVIIGIQNLILPDGVFARFANKTTNFLTDAIVVGPIPAVEDLAFDLSEDGLYHITHGTPTWAGQSLEDCENFIRTWGLTSFLLEAQHEVQRVEGGVFNHLEYRHVALHEVPQLLRIVTWLDPAITSTDQSDSCAIQIDGIAEDDTIYRLYSWERIASPTEAIEHAILKSIQLGATKVGIETDQGGDTWVTVYEATLHKMIEKKLIPEDIVYPAFDSEKASTSGGSKMQRARQELTDYENGRIVHVLGTHTVLEHALNRFPKQKPYDLFDASFYSWYDLRGKPKQYKAGLWGQNNG